MAQLKERPKLKLIYQMELAQEITGKTKYAIKKKMQREEITLAEAIRRYLTEFFTKS